MLITPSVSRAARVHLVGGSHDRESFIWDISRREIRLHKKSAIDDIYYCATYTDVVSIPIEIYDFVCIDYNSDAIYRFRMEQKC